MPPERRQVAALCLLAAQHHQPHRRQPLIGGQPAADRPVHGWGRVEDRDAFLVDQPDDPRDAGRADAERVERRAVQDRAEDIHDCGVEAVRREKRQPILAVDMQVVGIDPDMMQDVAVALHDPFWAPGRAGCVQDVGYRRRVNSHVRRAGGQRGRQLVHVDDRHPPVG